MGVTRFEDDARLPLGIAVNSASFAAKALTHVSSRRPAEPVLRNAAPVARGVLPLPPRSPCKPPPPNRPPPTHHVPTCRPRLPCCLPLSACHTSNFPPQVAVDPRFLQALLTLGMESDVTVQASPACPPAGTQASRPAPTCTSHALTASGPPTHLSMRLPLSLRILQDVSAFAIEGEELSYMQLQARAASVRQVSPALAVPRRPVLPSSACPGLAARLRERSAGPERYLGTNSPR